MQCKGQLKKTYLLLIMCSESDSCKVMTLLALITQQTTKKSSQVFEIFILIKSKYHTPQVFNIIKEKIMFFSPFLLQYNSEFRHR
jgi:hypothetical protein